MDTFQIRFGDSGMTTATADHIADFKSWDGGLSNLGDVIQTDGNVAGKPILFASGNFGSIENAAARALQMETTDHMQNLVFHNGQDAGACLIVDKATGNDYLFIDQNGDHVFETGVVLEGAAKLDQGIVMDHMFG